MARSRTATFGAMAVLVSVVVATGTAASDGDRHCAVGVLGTEQSGEFVLSEPVCFDEFDVMTEEFGAESLDSDFIIGTHYEHANLGGSSFSVWGSACTGGWLNVPSGWNDRISSTANGCYRVRHWEHVNLSGAQFDTFSPWGNITGVMNDKTSSIQYYGS